MIFEFFNGKNRYRYYIRADSLESALKAIKKIATTNSNWIVTEMK